MQEYFGLTMNPFTRELAPLQLFSSQQFQELLARLRYIVKHRALGLVTGEVGSGKSTAIRALAHGLDHTRNPLFYLSDSSLDPRGFYREVLTSLGLTPCFRKADARRQFDAALLEAYRNHGKAPVIVIDEAHLLPPAMVQEVRFITSFQMDSLSPFSLILVGQPELQNTLRLRAFEAVRQHIQVRFHLTGLTEPETRSYIEHAMKIAGAQRPVFSDTAIHLIHSHARGIPRLINNLCTACLLDVCAKEGRLVEEENVRRVVLDLQEA